METIFSLSNLYPLPFWLLMIVAPRWRWTQRIMRSPLVIAPLALLYAALVVPRAGALFGSLQNPTLAGIQGLLGSEEGATIGWIHFLAFDLFVGRWSYLDSQERRIHPLLMAPILFFTFMLGPFGFLLYLIARALAPQRGEAQGEG